MVTMVEVVFTAITAIITGTTVINGIRINMAINKTPPIAITIDDLQKRFIEYNRLYFHNRLKMPMFKIGTWSYGSIEGSYRHDKEGNPMISIRDTISLMWTDERLKNTLIHEMLHYYMDRNWSLDFDSGAHLLCWQTLRIYMNLKYGLHITTWPQKHK